MPTVLVTGATRGLGLSTAQACAQRGARVLCAGRDRRAVEAAAARARGEPVVLDLAGLAGVVRVSCFDPGLLPGTGLARQQPA